MSTPTDNPQAFLHESTKAVMELSNVFKRLESPLMYKANQALNILWNIQDELKRKPPTPASEEER